MHDVHDDDVGLRETKKRATRRDLARATRRLALEHGWDAVTVEQVCAEVGVSVRTFHNYFPSKDAAALGEETPLATRAVREAFVAGGPTGDLLSDLLVLVDDSDRLTPDVLDDVGQAVELAQREPRLLGLWVARGAGREAEIRGLLAARLGTDADDPRCHVAAGLASTAVRLAWGRWHHDPATPLAQHLATVREQLTDLVRTPQETR